MQNPDYLIKAILAKKLSLWNKLLFSIPYIFATLCGRPWIFQTLNSVKTSNLSLKNQWFTAIGCKDIGSRKFEFVATTQFLLCTLLEYSAHAKRTGFMPQTSSNFVIPIYLQPDGVYLFYFKL